MAVEYARARVAAFVGIDLFPCHNTLSPFPPPSASAIRDEYFSYSGASTRSGISESSQVAVGHNSGLINYQAMRKKLKARTSIFNTTADTEVVRHLIATSLSRPLLARIRDAYECLRDTVDISAAMVSEAQQQAQAALAAQVVESPAFRMPRFDIHDLESTDGRYHVVVCLDVLNYYPRVEEKTRIRHLASLAGKRRVLSCVVRTICFNMVKRVVKLFPDPSKATYTYLHAKRELGGASRDAGCRVANCGISVMFYFAKLFLSHKRCVCEHQSPHVLPWPPPPLAHRLFDEMLMRNVISWNIGILVKTGCTQPLCSEHRGPPPPPWPPPPKLARNLFEEMTAEYVELNALTVTVARRFCHFSKASWKFCMKCYHCWPRVAQRIGCGITCSSPRSSRRRRS